MSPISTAHLNPNGHTFCLSSSESGIFIPILFNNTRPISVKYSLTPPGYNEDEANVKVEYFDLNAKDLKAIEQSRIDELPVKTIPDNHDTDEYDEYDDDGEGDTAGQNIYFPLQKTQSLAHIRITKPGTIRLMRVLEMSNVESRIGYPSEVTVVPCPRVQFVEDVALAGEQDIRCAKRNSNLELIIDMYGVPPLTLRWSKVVNGKREDFSVDGIEPGHDHSEQSSPGVLATIERGRSSVVHNLKIPLTVSLESPGTHLYALEEIVDGPGNNVHVGSDLYPLTFLDTSKNGHSHKPALDPKLTHSLVVLRRPTVSFKHCGPGSPTRLLIGSEAPLTISAHDSDTLDTPWEVNLKYQPIDGDGGKRFKPWKKTLKTLTDKKELVVSATAPGEYTILSVKGKVQSSSKYSFC
jgi:nucleoporin POM152